VTDYIKDTYLASLNRRDVKRKIAAIKADRVRFKGIIDKMTRTNTAHEIRRKRHNKRSSCSFLK